MIQIQKSDIADNVHPELQAHELFSTYVDMLYEKMQHQEDIIGGSIVSAVFLRSKSDPDFFATYWLGKMVHFQIGDLVVQTDAYFRQNAIELIDGYIRDKGPLTMQPLDFTVRFKKGEVWVRRPYTNGMRLKETDSETLKIILNYIAQGALDNYEKP